MKANRRRADAAKVAKGQAEALQERKRALPAAPQFRFTDEEKILPAE